jgi:hypothetical protein
LHNAAFFFTGASVIDPFEAEVLAAIGVRGVPAIACGDQTIHDVSVVPHNAWVLCCYLLFAFFNVSGIPAIGVLLPLLTLLLILVSRLLLASLMLLSSYKLLVYIPFCHCRF